MKLKKFQMGALFALSLFATYLLASGVSALVGPKSIAPLVEEVKASVVNITSIKSSRSSIWTRRWTQPSRAIGTGVIIDADNGYIVTNEHLISNSERVMVTLEDEREFEAEIIGDDAASDVAVLKITADDLTAVPLADSDETRVGDFVFAIGNPFGQLQNTVTSGIVSGLGRTGMGIGDIEDFIQTDAAINEWHSGGTLINFSCEVIGINTAIIGNSGNIGIAFAIPSNLVKEVVEELLEFGGIPRGILGIHMRPVRLDEVEEYSRLYGIDELKGVMVTQVVNGTGASEAGIKTYDVITTFNGEQVVGVNELVGQVKQVRVGDTVPVELFRDGEFMTVHAEIRTRTFMGDRIGLAGAALGEIHAQDEHFEKLKGDGWVVRDILEDSQASKLGLQVNDVILRADIPQPGEDGPAVYEIFRDGENITITAPED
ncbi:MAG: PDZ domain-containing protein [Gammaproteobacteria bacterium]|nr:PDZ domain-containing protein [Gammaproteobacteria bacterium]